MNHLGKIIMCVIAVMAIKIAVVSLGLQTLGFSVRASILGGLSLAQISEISLFLVARAHEYHLISRHTYLMVVATTVVLLVRAGPVPQQGRAWGERGGAVRLVALCYTQVVA
jgi:predicted Kef-type K+ transport protein